MEEIFGAILEGIYELLLSVTQNKKIHISIRFLIIGAMFIPFVALFTFLSVQSFESKNIVLGAILSLVCVGVVAGMVFLIKKAICAK